MSDYERVARMIKYLDEHHLEQPELADIARQCGLSTSHFHRLFSRWAGVTPKDFVQCLTLSHARQLLREGESVLNASINSGLSGPGRLHDLCVTLEAASPGEMKSGGAGLEIRYGFAKTPFGEWLAAETARGVCHLAFVGEGKRTIAVNELRNEWPRARFVRLDEAAEKLSDELFVSCNNGAQGSLLRAYVRGSKFQIKVWEALVRVRAGALTTYGRLAEAIGNPGAARAVGTAVAANTVACLIPCHRVIRETGIVGNYKWGGLRKRSLLAWEAARPLRRAVTTTQGISKL